VGADSILFEESVRELNVPHVPPIVMQQTMSTDRFSRIVRAQEANTGANPTIASYNASVVKIYSAVNSMARF
jgi:hypothetical protein